MSTMTTPIADSGDLVQPLQEDASRPTLRSLYQGIAQFHENQRLIEITTTLPGNLLLWLATSLLLNLAHQLILLPLMILSQLFPAQRLRILGVGLGALFLHRRLVNELHVTNFFWIAVDTGILVGLLYLFYRLARSFASLPGVVRSNPQIFLHLLLWCCLLPMFLLPTNFRDNPAWVVATHLSVCMVFFTFLVWRIGFMLYSGKRGSIQKTGFWEHLIYALPYLGPTQVAYGKGLDYLTSKLATNRLDLAKSQLAGVKLLALAAIWTAVLKGMDLLFVGSHLRISMFLPPIPIKLYHLDTLIALGAQQVLPLGIVWASLIVDMVYETVALAAVGHVIIGCLRLCGFNLFRNTYKPLLATSLSEFWNRYYYYFKELLVDFFFFPTYLSYFRKHPKLRIFAATMSSACLGNLYYHALQNFDDFVARGEAVSFSEFGSYTFYAFVLAIGIYVSILREQRQRGTALVERSPSAAFLLTLRKIAGVWLFFSLLRIWDHQSAAFMQDTRFFFALFGIHL
ncbi:MAG: hypothetical protein H7836_01040 [Magnetococcus sp. YQC-3]